MFAGTVMTGGKVTVTVNDFDVVREAASVTEQFTVVVPRKKRSPDTLLHVGVSGPLATSVAVTVKLTATPAPAVTPGTTMFAGTVRTGGVVSRTFTLKKRFADRPVVGSTAVQMTLLSPSGAFCPDAG